MIPAPVIIAEDLTRVYHGVRDAPVVAVSGVNLAVYPGEVILVRGPNGSGKTTLLSILGCLLRPTSGRLSLLGIDIVGSTDARLEDFRRKTIGFVFQTFRLLDGLTVKENVELPVRLNGVGHPGASRRALCLLDMLGVAHRAEFPPSRLSGGEKQRAAIARALANDPRVVLADEPTGNLDSQAGRDAVDLLSRSVRSEGRSLVIVSHDSRIETFADRVLSMEDGKLTG